jgi:hypothetical protein
MSNQMNRTRDQIEAHLAKVQTTRIARLVRRISDEFLTVGAFLDAPKASIMAVYRKVCPDAKRDLGKRFFEAYDEVRRFCAEPPAEEPASAPAAQGQTPPASAPAEQKPAPQQSLSFSLPQLKALTNVMDLCSIQKVDVVQMAIFLNACHATIPEM